MKKVLFINAMLFFIISIADLSFSEENKYNIELEFGSSPAERVLQFLGIEHVRITGYSGSKVLLSSTEIIFQNEIIYKKHFESNLDAHYFEFTFDRKNKTNCPLPASIQNPNFL